MAHTKSSQKDLRRIEKRSQRNRAHKGNMRTTVKKARLSVETGADDTNAKIKLAEKILDKMATKGIIHPNQAARKKSRLRQRQNSIRKGDSPVETKSTTKKVEPPVVETTIVENPETPEVSESSTE